MVQAWNSRQSSWITLCLGSLVFLVSANLFTINFVGRERYVYFWDLSNYWGKVTRLSQQVVSGPAQALRDVIRSVRQDDYNNLAAVLLLPGVFLGQTRVAYILSIVNIFLVPAAVSSACVHLVLRRLSGHPTSTLVPLTSLAVVLLSPAVWSPILYGYPDVGGVVLLNVVLLLYLRSGTPHEHKYDAILMALLIPMAVFFRRWYAFWAVTFYGSLVVERCASLALGRLRDYRKALLAVFLQGAIAAGVLLVVAPSFALKSATTNYGDIYSAYRFSSSLWDSGRRIVEYVGLLWLCLFIAGAAQVAFDKATRHVAIVLIVQWGAIVFLFSRTQDFGTQHFYLLLPAMLLCNAVCPTRLFLKARALGWTVVSLLILNLVGTFTSSEVWFWVPTAHIFTGSRHPPLVRGDLTELEGMLGVLRHELTAPDDRAYVLASSWILNSGILREADLSLGGYRDVSQKILLTHDVDRRDGFPRRLLGATYVIVATPVQYHLRQSDQRVVGSPAELVLEGRQLGAAFVKLPYEFALDAGVKGYLYRRVRPLRDSEVGALSDMLRRYYPDRPSIYEPGR